MTTIEVRTDFTFQAGQKLNFTNETAFDLPPDRTTPITLTIAGEASATRDDSNTAFGVRALVWSPGGWAHVVVAEFGVLNVAHQEPWTAIAILAGSGTQSVVNRGVIEVRSRKEAIGVLTSEPTIVLVENSGRITVEANSVARGVSVLNGGSFINSGAIEVTAPEWAPWGGYAVYIPAYNSSFRNSGKISATSTDPIAESIAVRIGSANGTFSFENTGTLKGDVALFVDDSPGIPPSNTYTNGGEMLGAVRLTSTGDTLVNSNLIAGNVLLRGGDDRYDGRTGMALGVIDGGDGADTLAGGDATDTLLGGAGDDSIVGGAGRNYLRGDDGFDRLAGGSAFDDINGNVGDDTATGGGGDDWVVGGKDDDLLNGEEGDDVVLGNLGDDWADGGPGADTIRGGQDDDVVFGQDGDDWISGDRGADVLSGGQGADIFHTFRDAGLDRVVDFNRAQGDRVMVDRGTTYTVNQSGTDVLIDMGGGNQMVLVGVQMSSLAGDWIFAA